MAGDAEPTDGATRGAEILEDYQLHRARMDDRRVWREGLVEFARAWESFKSDADLWDFTDLVERALHELPFGPGRPEQILCDEVQDFSRLEITLVRRWAQHARDLILTGDPLQAIFDWRGADSELFHNPDARREILCETAPSYRCPRAVWERATTLASDLLAAEGVSYRPREASGVVSFAPSLGRWRPDDRPSMLLASCHEMLKGPIRALRRAGLPYHNPYGRSPGPLRADGTAGTLLALLASDTEWTWAEIRRWMPHLKAECFRGRKGASVEAIPADDEPWSAAAMTTYLREVLHFGAVSALWDAVDQQRPDPYVDLCVESFQRGASYPADVVRTVGARELARQMALPPKERPWHVVSTIHGTKGGESDRVVVWPDLSPAFYRQGRVPGWSGRDALIRLFYVALTRAREELVIGAPRGGMAIAI